jgi:PAS domain S-box-containing protein
VSAETDIELAALRAEVDLLRRVADGVPAMVGYWGADQRCRFANRAYESWFGVKPQALLGMHMQDLLKHLYVHNLPFIEGVLRGEPQAFQRAFPTPYGGPPVHALTRYTPDVVDRRVVGFMVLITDDTAAHNLQEELRRAMEAAEAAAAAKSRFVANMSHEMRTPLNGIVGMTDVLLTTSLTPEQQEAAQTIRTSTGALLSVINEVLDLSRLEADRVVPEQIPFELEPILAEVADMFAQPSTAQGLEFILQVEPVLGGAVVGDPTRLRQVLINLMGNAVKFTRQGTVVVDVRLVSSNDTTLTVRFDVVDTGIGIPPDVLTQLFTPFVQADASTTRRLGGTGLGLSITKHVVERLGGSIEVTSREGEGSTFSVTMPFGRTPTSIEDAEPHPSLQSRDVVVVAEPPALRMQLMRDLASLGALPSTVGDANAVLEVLRVQAQTGRKAADIWINSALHDTDCFEFIDAIRAAHPLTPPRFVVLVPRADLDTQARARRDGHDVLLKPLLRAGIVRGLHARVADEPRAPTTSSTTHFEGKRVLVVEDNAVNQLVALRLLARLGVRADLAQHGEEAVHRCHACRYDLVLMDCHMPVMDGFDATRALLALPDLLRPQAVVALTAGVTSDDHARCIAAGMHDHLSKPVTLQTLERVLRKWLPPSSAAPSPALPG